MKIIKRITRKLICKEKQQYGYFKRQTDEIGHEKTWMRKQILKRETESLLMAAQNNSLLTNYVKVKIGKTQKNRKCRSCGDRDKSLITL